MHTALSAITATMPQISLAILIFLVVLFTQTVAWVGKSVLQDAVSYLDSKQRHSSRQAFNLYSTVFYSRTASKQRALRKQVLADKAELAKTSSQDEFAKWAKLKRKLDKGLADLEKLSELLRRIAGSMRWNVFSAVPVKVRSCRRLSEVLLGRGTVHEAGPNHHGSQQATVSSTTQQAAPEHMADDQTPL